MSFDPSCIRRTANWTTITKEHKFDKASFDPEVVLKDLPKSSPKLQALLNNIHEIDERDMKTHGQKFKHFIFSEVKQGGYGVKIITAALIASGFNLAYDNKLKLSSDEELLKTKGENFLLLCSTDLYSIPISVRKKKEILDKYNQRPANSLGDLARLILLDSGYKEGVDLFDVKYVHIFEPLTSKADLKQAIGRATRLCGQKGLPFDEKRGWPLRVYLYDVALPADLKEKYLDSDTLFKLYLKSNNIDLNMMEFTDELEKYTIIGAIDYELTKNVHRFEIEDDEFYVPLYKLFQEGGRDVLCSGKCGRVRMTKDVPVSVPLFMTVLAAQGKVFPLLEKTKKVREYFCDELRNNKSFCDQVKEAWADPNAYLQTHKVNILNALDNNYQKNMPAYNRRMFKRFVSSIVEPKQKPVKQVIPQVTPQQVKPQVTPQQVKPQSQVTPQQVKPQSQVTPQQVKPQVTSQESKQVTPQQVKPQSQVTSQESKQVTPQQVKPQSQVTSQESKQVTPQQVKPQSQVTPQQVKPQSQVTPQQVKPQSQVTPQQVKPQSQDFKTSQESKQVTPQQVKPQSQESKTPQVKSPPKEELVQIVKSPSQIHEDDKVYQVPNKIMTFLEVRNFMRDNFIEFTWPKVHLENLCQTRGGSDLVNFTPTQDLIRNYFTPKSAYKGILLWHTVGTGKCHGKNTKILMYDGSIKLVQDVQIGDQLMGDDSTPRTVLALGRGQDNMYKIKQEYGDDYTVNSEHILCLKDNQDNIIEIEVKDYLAQNNKLSGFKTDVIFNHKETIFDSYDIGFELIKDHVSTNYLFSSKNTRLYMLAGIIDHYGMISNNEYILPPIKNLQFLARSLGFYADLKSDKIHIVGNNIPVRNPQLKLVNNISKYDIQIEHIGFDNYYGFTLDGNQRYLLGDFTVTHNTCCAIATASSSYEKEGYTVLWVTRTTLKSDIWKNMFDQVCSMVIQDKMLKGQTIPADPSKRQRMLSKSWKIKPMSYKQFSNLISGKNQLYNDLVAINGSQDPLRKTLLIIDEAHKLYGTGDLSGNERPDMSKLHKAIMHSYETSKADSVKVMLMTATPITNDPMELIKLINLCREVQIPDDYGKFMSLYLNEFGKFTKKGMRQYLDDIAGSISFLSREKDARQFSQPTLIPVTVPLSTGENSVDIDSIESEINNKLDTNKSEIGNYKELMSKIKQHRIQSKKQFKTKCVGRKGPERQTCLQEAELDIMYQDKTYESDLTDYAEKISELTQSTKTLKKDLQLKKKQAKEEVSQKAIIDNKCIKTKRVKKVTPRDKS
jgi:hypothetical protein